MKTMMAATAALALLTATAAIAQEQSEMRPPVTEDQSTGGTNGVIGPGKNAAPGITGSAFGSSTDSTATAGGTGQPGTGDRTIDEDAGGMGASGSSSYAAPANSAGYAAPSNSPGSGGNAVDNANTMDKSGGAMGGSLAGPAGTLGGPVGGPPAGSP